MDKLIFTKANQESAESLIESSEQGIFNFLNLYSVYLFRNEKLFKDSVIGRECHNFIDGMGPTLFLSLKYKERINRLSGPVFTRRYLPKLRNKKILFVGNCGNKDRDELCKKFHLSTKKVGYYNTLPFIAPKIKFPKSDLINLSNFIKKTNPEIIFICVGNPRQEILAKDLIKRCKNKKFICVGAALDFLLGRKQEAPKFIRELGLEWFYRLITDFKYSKKKVWKSLIAIKYLNKIDIK
jgi:exopolysaccharide biosynthesis WecB/TagA/CpsF family protein